jgi:hypothetical protein
VISTSIQAVGYEDGALEVEFQNDSTYQYDGVPEFLFRGFLTAQSKGHFFRSRIQDRYPIRQIR